MAEVVASNLPSNRTESGVKALFEPYGTVKSIELPAYAPNFALIKMSTTAEAQVAASGVNGTSYNGKVLRVVVSRTSPAGNTRAPRNIPKTMVLVISNLPSSRERKELKGILKHYGDVENIKFPNDAEDQAIVEMSTKEEGRAVIKAIDGLTYNGNTIHVAKQ